MAVLRWYASAVCVMHPCLRGLCVQASIPSGLTAGRRLVPDTVPTSPQQAPVSYHSSTLTVHGRQTSRGQKNGHRSYRHRLLGERVLLSNSPYAARSGPMLHTRALPSRGGLALGKGAGNEVRVFQLPAAPLEWPQTPAPLLRDSRSHGIYSYPSRRRR